jgi:hypothetical protein
MSSMRELPDHTRPTARRAVIHVSELMQQIERMSQIRKRVLEGYYNRPDILSEIAGQLSQRLHR